MELEDRLVVDFVQPPLATRGDEHEREEHDQKVAGVDLEEVGCVRSHIVYSGHQPTDYSECYANAEIEALLRSVVCQMCSGAWTDCAEHAAIEILCLDSCFTEVGACCVVASSLEVSRKVVFSRSVDIS